MSEETNLSSVPNEAAPAPAQPGGKRAAPMKNEKKNRTGLVIGIVAAVLVLAYAGLCAAAQTLYAHAAFPGTSVLGLDVSRLSAQQAEQLWTEQGEALLQKTAVTLTRDGADIASVSLSDLGVTVLPPTSPAPPAVTCRTGAGAARWSRSCGAAGALPRACLPPRTSRPSWMWTRRSSPPPVTT